MKFTLRSLFVLTAIVAAYSAGWATALHHYESQLDGMSHELAYAVSEVNQLRLEVAAISADLEACRSKSIPE